MYPEVINVTMAILLGVICALCFLIAYIYKQNLQERAKLINALVSKNATEAAQMDMADKLQVKVEKNAPTSEFIPEPELSIEDWEKAIQ